MSSLVWQFWKLGYRAEEVKEGAGGDSQGRGRGDLPGVALAPRQGSLRVGKHSGGSRNLGVHVFLSRGSPSPWSFPPPRSSLWSELPTHGLLGLGSQDLHPVPTPRVLPPPSMCTPSVPPSPLSSVTLPHLPLPTASPASLRSRLPPCLCSSIRLLGQALSDHSLLALAAGLVPSLSDHSLFLGDQPGCQE